MSTEKTTPKRARSALAGYLRLLAACLEDEADLIESDSARGDDVLRRFRDGVLALSLQDAPLDTLVARGTPVEAAVVVQGTAATPQPAPKRRR
jgi:hypothetical protein